MYYLWEIFNLLLIVGINAFTLTFIGTRFTQKNTPHWFLVVICCAITIWFMSSIGLIAVITH